MTKTNPREGKTWPAYIFGGRLRTSTLVLILAFVGIGWIYHDYEPAPRVPEQVPASEVVPPGFIPDPAYTWAPRTDFQRQTPTTTTPTSTEPTTSEPTTSTTAPGEEQHGSATPGAPTSPSTPAPSTTTAPPPGPSPGPPTPAPPPGA